MERKLKREYEWLKTVIKDANERLFNAPKGQLRIAKKRKNVEYYYKEENSNRNSKSNNGRYIRKEEYDLAVKLAQRDYDKVIINNAKERAKCIEEFLKNYQKTDLSEAYLNTNSYRKKLISPVILPDEEYVKQWQSVVYQGKKFADDDIEIITEKGERVRSKSEKIIADKLFSLGIPYRYEYPLKLSDGMRVYPDFTILKLPEREEVYLEHFGMMDIIMNEADRKQSEYEEKLENFRNLSEEQISDTTFNSIKEMTMDAVEDTKKIRREMAEKVIADCNEKLIQYTNDPNCRPAEAYNPNFTETDFDKIDADAKEATSGYGPVEEGLTFKKIENKPYHYLKEHVSIVVNSISSRLDTEIIPIMKNNVRSYVTKCTEIYRDKLLEHKRELESEYNKLLKAQIENENVQKMIYDYEERCNNMEKDLEVIKVVKGELQNYVRE